VVEQRPLTSVVRHVVLRLEEPAVLTFRPGQFVQFVLDEHTLRAFSIASPPGRLPLVELCADISPMGKGSRFIEGLQPGDQVTFRGPFGVFTLPPGQTRPLEFVAAGSGIAPLRAMLADLFTEGRPPAPATTLTFGNRTRADILYHEEWRALQVREPRFQYQPVLSQPASDWDGLRGRVTEILAARKAELGQRVFFLCGSPVMVDDTRQALAAFGVTEENVHFEKFH